MLIRLFFSVPFLSVLLCVSPACADVGELSSSSVHAYQTEFKEADQNKDGVLDGEELKAYLQPFPEEMFEILVRRRSSQGHVAATVEDLLEVAKLMKRWKGYDPRVVKSNRLLWEYADRNDDGTLDKEEISQGKLVSGHRQILLEKMDASSQGITFSTFMDAFGEFLRDVEMRRTMENILYRHHGAKDQPISSLLTAYEDKDEVNVQEKDERKEEELNSRHADFFRSFDTNGDEVISGKEGHELPRSIKSAFFGATLKDGELHVPLEGPPISIDQFHEVVESLYQARLKKILAQRHAEGEKDRQRGLERYISSLLPGSSRSRGNDTDEVVTIESSPHASYFQHLDQDGNGVVEGDEFANLPSFLESGFHQRFPDAWSKKQITIREFHTYWENLKRERSAAKRRSNEDRRYAEYRAKLFSSDEVDPQVTKKPESEEAAAVANAPADTATEATINDKIAVPDSCTVDIVLIRRAQEDLPERTLAEEVMSMLKEPGPPLSAKLLPWLADKSNQQVELFDYIQAKSIAGKQITIQRGGREAYPSNISQMGGGRSTTSYSFHNVGTLVSVNASDFVEGKLELEITFEKSYVDAVTEDKEPADKEVAESPEAATSTEEAAETSSPKTRDEMLNELRARQRSSASRVVASTAPTPPSIETITAEGKLRLEPQSPAVLTEIARKKGDQLEEIVVLVEWR